MAYWLLKTEPEEFSWDEQVKRGKKGETWSGVRNFTARGHLKEMKKGDKFFFYHTGDEKQVVGIGEVIRRGLSRSDGRKERTLGRGADRSDRAAAQAGDVGRSQGRSQAQGYGAGEIFATVGPAGRRRGMEARMQNGWDKGLMRRYGARPCRSSRRRRIMG